MLENAKNLLSEAKKNGYAVGAFNTSDLEITKAIIRAAEAQRAPVIVQVSEKAIAYAGLAQIATIIIEEAKLAKVPVALHLDHGKSLDVVSKCLKAGFTSIMFDGSSLSLAENTILTMHAAEMAHRAGVPCEGELGHVGKAGEIKGFTDPNDVGQFVKKTKVDFLAVSFGSSHGVDADEKLDIELLKKLNKKSPVPLVLHGASGVSAIDIKQAINNGIAKINIDTDIRHTFSKSIYSLSKVPELEDPREIMEIVMEKIQKLVEQKIMLFGSTNKAKNE